MISANEVIAIWTNASEVQNAEILLVHALSINEQDDRLVSDDMVMNARNELLALLDKRIWLISKIYSKE